MRKIKDARGCLLCYRLFHIMPTTDHVCGYCYRWDVLEERKIFRRWLAAREMLGADVGRVVAEYLLNFFAAKKGGPSL
jgi:hypothetical protein